MINIVEKFNETTEIANQDQDQDQDQDDIVDENIAENFDEWLSNVEKLVLIENTIQTCSTCSETNFLITGSKNISCYMTKPVAKYKGKLLRADQSVKITDIEHIKDISDDPIALYSIITYSTGYTVARYALI